MVSLGWSQANALLAYEKTQESKTLGWEKKKKSTTARPGVSQVWAYRPSLCCCLSGSARTNTLGGS